MIKPWLEAGRGRLERSYVIVASRGQAHGWKQRCLQEKVPLLGVEFLSPGLARKKWRAWRGGEEARPVMGRELLLLGLRALIAERLEGLVPGEGDWGLWKSLQSDPERALDDFDELMKGGFRAKDFPLAALREGFGELEAWVERQGYGFAPREAEEAALPKPGTAEAEAKAEGRVLVCGLGVEMWGEFFNVVAFVRRHEDITVLLPEPAFRGGTGADERWVEIWGAVLGVAEPQGLEEAGAEAGCEALGTLWLRDAAGSAERARLVVGRTRVDEMGWVTNEIIRWLNAGAESIAVVFPKADGAHLSLARRLVERGVPFADLLETAGPPTAEVQVQRGLLGFYERGGRLDELLEVWPWLHALGLATLPVAKARGVCERLFGEGHAHALAAHEERLSGREHADWKEVWRVAAKLLPAWPERLTLGEGVERFAALCEGFELESLPGWGALTAFAKKSEESFPLVVVTQTLASFLPESQPVKGAAGKGEFARVTLTTRRRAEGLAWSHVILVESNAGVWPERREPSCWLTDAQREGLTAAGRFGLGVFTSEERARFERQGYALLAGDTAEEVVFSAALFDEADPEMRLAPNSWVERVLWAQGLAAGEGGIEGAFERAAVAVRREAEVKEAWGEVWHGRRDPARRFDRWFFGVGPEEVRPRVMAARLMEAGVRDPVAWWFEGVLDLRRAEWGPLLRNKALTVGQVVHRLLASALRPAETGRGGLGPRPSDEEARGKLKEALAALRRRWPADRYWDSVHGEVAQVCGDLLEAVLRWEGFGFVGTEFTLPAGAWVPLGPRRIEVAGRIDLVLSDRPEWAGARVLVLDFKTGGDAKLSAKAMGEKGASLQLGVYLAAVRSLGAEAGEVRMLKAGAEDSGAVGLHELEEALASLDRLGVALESGVYGALTPDRSEYSKVRYEWPLACAPVKHTVLREKYVLTHGGAGGEGVEEGGGDE